MAESSDHGFTLSDVGGQIQVSYFDYRDEILEWFQTRDLQGGGYTWEALARSALELEGSPYAQDVSYDSEGDAFFAMVSSKEAAEALKSAIERLASDPEFRGSCVAHAEERGDLE